MPNYRRHRVPGGTYFFTVNLLERQRRLFVTEIETLREAVRKVRAARPFLIDCWVVLPDHLHCVWTLPPDDADYPARWKAIKIAFSKSIPKTERLSAVRLANGERGIWQRRYWAHSIRDDLDYARHVDYVHFNPVKHGHVARVRDGPYSSFSRYVAAGIYPIDWASDDGEKMLVGERG